MKTKKKIVKFYEIFIFIASYRPISIMCHNKHTHNSHFVNQNFWHRNHRRKTFHFLSVNVCRFTMPGRTRFFWKWSGRILNHSMMSLTSYFDVFFLFWKFQVKAFQRDFLKTLLTYGQPCFHTKTKSRSKWQKILLWHNKSFKTIGSAVYFLSGEIEIEFYRWKFFASFFLFWALLNDGESYKSTDRKNHPFD